MRRAQASPRVPAIQDPVALAQRATYEMANRLGVLGFGVRSHGPRGLGPRAPRGRRSRADQLARDAVASAIKLDRLLVRFDNSLKDFK